jgi:tetratricopeptide (TPR) repeat protein
MAARLQLLGASGVAEESERLRVAAASAGLPFYLHLAVDTQRSDSDGDTTRAATQEEILQRFLQHVATDEVRTLEVLSVARVFDTEIFRALTSALHLPGHLTAWESISSYSFVYPAGGCLRFHQLMAQALRDRLSAAARVELHGVLRGAWEQRAFDHQADGRRLADPVALREMVFHALHLGGMAGVELLDLADLAVRAGADGAAGGILADLRDFLREAADQSTPDLRDTALVLDVDAVLRRGEAQRALDLTPDMTWDASSPVGARLAVAAGQARRIAGRTSDAMEIYSQVWSGDDDTARMGAGLWAADLHMCQGRFVDSEQLAAELDAIAERQHPECRGDVARLRHLAYRFAFDLAGSRRFLDQAAGYYEAAASYLGNANIRTNRAELLALTDPEAAIVEARAAIELQTEIGAQHELGKCFTAIAVAHLRCGRLDEAATALATAVEALQRAGYRSGLARARLYQAVMEARRGQLDRFVASARWAVAELEEAEVYPTLIVSAGAALRVLRIQDDEVDAACVRAKAVIQPLGALEDMMARIDTFVRDLLGEAA